MRCSRPSLFIVAALSLAQFALSPARVDAAGNGLKPADAQHLHRLGYAVVPNPVPAGFHVAKVTYDPGDAGYHVRYVRSSDGATFTISGMRGAAGGASGGGATAEATPAPAKHGIFAGIASAFNRHVNPSPNVASNNGTKTSGEAEENGQKGVVMDSKVVGTMALLQQPGGSCYAGNANTASGTIHTARFAVEMCNMDQPDPVVRAYRSLQKL